MDGNHGNSFYIEIFGDIGLDLIVQDQMVQNHIWNAHCSKSMFVIFFRSIMLFKYGPGACLKLSNL